MHVVYVCNPSTQQAEVEDANQVIQVYIVRPGLKNKNKHPLALCEPGRNRL